MAARPSVDGTVKKFTLPPARRWAVDALILEFA